jgi:hypothetical protein
MERSKFLSAVADGFNAALQSKASKKKSQSTSEEEPSDYDSAANTLSSSAKSDNGKKVVKGLKKAFGD